MKQYFFFFWFIVCNFASEKSNIKIKFMRKKIKLLAIMIALTKYSAAMFPSTTSMHYVSLTYQHGTLLGNNPKPAKTPSEYRIPLCVFLDEENQRLQVTAFTDGEFIYNIYNEYEESVSQGYLNCINNGCYCINLDLLTKVTYQISVTYNGHSYVGIFDINK